MTLPTMRAGTASREYLRIAGGHGAAADQSDRTPADRAFIRACYGPPEDRGQGSLYPAIIQLLNAARELPSEVMLLSGPQRADSDRATGGEILELAGRDFRRLLETATN